MATMFNERQQGNLPRTSEVNPRREHCKAITPRNGKIVEKSVQANDEEKSKDNDENSTEKLKTVLEMLKKLRSY